MSAPIITKSMVGYNNKLKQAVPDIHDFLCISIDCVCLNDFCAACNRVTMANLVLFYSKRNPNLPECVQVVGRALNEYWQIFVHFS